MARKTLKDTVLLIQDGATGKIEILIGDGNITWSESYPREYTAERGVIADGTIRDADQEALEVSITATWEFIKGDVSTPVVTPYDALTRTGGAAAWVTTGADACEPYAVDIKIFFSLPCTTSGSPKQELVVFPEFRVESCNFDVEAGTLQFSGKCKAVRPTVTRTNTALTTT